MEPVVRAVVTARLEMPRRRPTLDFDAGIAELGPFRRQHGHSRVSRRSSPALFAWCHHLRTTQRLGCLAPEHRRRLDAVGFEWPWRTAPGAALRGAPCLGRGQGPTGDANARGVRAAEMDGELARPVAPRQTRGRPHRAAGWPGAHACTSRLPWAPARSDPEGRGRGPGPALAAAPTDAGRRSSRADLPPLQGRAVRRSLEGGRRPDRAVSQPSRGRRVSPDIPSRCFP